MRALVARFVPTRECSVGNGSLLTARSQTTRPGRNCRVLRTAYSPGQSAGSPVVTVSGFTFAPGPTATGLLEGLFPRQGPRIGRRTSNPGYGRSPQRPRRSRTRCGGATNDALDATGVQPSQLQHAVRFLAPHHRASFMCACPVHCAFVSPRANRETAHQTDVVTARCGRHRDRACRREKRAFSQSLPDDPPNV